MLYHISPTGGITTLTPRVSTHGKAYVYAIDNLVTGLLFGAKKDDFDFLLTTTEEGIPEVYECYPNSFDRVYQGKQCSIYEVAETGFMRGKTSWKPELVCETEVAVLKETFVDNLYERLMQAEEEGELIIHHYDNSLEYRKIIAQHVMDRVVRFRAFHLVDSDERFQKYYKDMIDVLFEVMDGHLLCTTDVE